MTLCRDATLQAFESTPVGLCTTAKLAYAQPMGHIPEDSALMLRYQDGDTAAFETLYRRHNDALYRYLLRHCRNRAAAEDVFQEVWGKIIKARASYRPTAKFTTFMYRVAHNCFIDHIRRNKRHSNTTEFEPDLYADTSEQPDTIAERSLAKELVRLDQFWLVRNTFGGLASGDRTSKQHLRRAIDGVHVA
jgi:RNA polymerase sigma factor (sigma-70 family)